MLSWKVMAASVLILTVDLALTRLLPILVPPKHYQYESRVLDVCRMTTAEVQPFVLVVFALATDPPERFLRRLHETVGTAILLTNNSSGKRLDNQVALMMVNDAETVTLLAKENPTPWDQMSHYIWLMPRYRRVKFFVQIFMENRFR